MDDNVQMHNILVRIHQQELEMVSTWIEISPLRYIWSGDF